jgi:hypothetical protein
MANIIKLFQTRDKAVTTYTNKILTELKEYIEVINEYFTENSPQIDENLMWYDAILQDNDIILIGNSWFDVGAIIIKDNDDHIYVTEEMAELLHTTITFRLPIPIYHAQNVNMLLEYLKESEAKFQQHDENTGEEINSQNADFTDIEYEKNKFYVSGNGTIQ